MMRLILAISLSMVYQLTAWGQADQEWPLITELSFIVNPALVSEAEDLAIVASHGKKWRRIRSSPSQSNIGLILPFSDVNMTCGAQVFSESVGPFKSVGTRLAYAYQFRLSRIRTDQLSLGLSTRLMHIKFDQEHFINNDVSDPLVQDIETNGFVPPSFSAGFHYRTGVANYATPVQFTISGSVGKVIPFEDRFGSFSLDRTFQWYGSAGLDIAANADMVVQPVLLYSHIAQRPGNLGFRTSAHHRRFGWVMLQYERTKILTSQIGINVNLGPLNMDIFQVSFSNGWHVGPINGQLGNSFTFGVVYKRGYRSRTGQ
ncbi:MAG: type IX secretion system membrane protein PorP/SprF [Saprospiraceae bacterium]|nr:type IX secretion system membrane protein PorP/SprF [Saprospiraceae bacterium]